MKPIITCILLNLFLFNSYAHNKELTADEIIINHTETTFILEKDYFGDTLELINKNETVLAVYNKEKEYYEIPFEVTQKERLAFQFGEDEYWIAVNPVPLWMSILPPLIAILLALLFKEVITALLMGILAGIGVMGYYSQGFMGVLKAPLDFASYYLPEAIVPGVMEGHGVSDHISVLVFSTIIGGVVAVISKNGGMMGIVNALSRFSTTPRSGMFTTYILGLMIFFDDYANTLVVGNTMKSVSDKLKISREKLAYIVDSTAAPVASIALVTTWIGAQLNYISDGTDKINEMGANQINEGAYSIFFSSLSYSFYPVLALVFMFMLIYMKRDFGPMLKFEEAARRGEKSEGGGKVSDEEFEPKDESKASLWNALIPILVLVLGTLTALFFNGKDAILNDADKGAAYLEKLGFFTKLSEIIGASDSFYALLVASVLALTTAVIMSVFKKLLTLQESMDSALNGMKSMLSALSILILAWALAITTEQMHTADFITGLFRDMEVAAQWVPTVTFVFAALIAFSTGSSWSTMAILYPIMLPTAWLLGIDEALNPDLLNAVFYSTVSAVLAGSVLGDHCSPISDTTILSSLATSCNHINHVKSQMPYALTVGGISIVLGIIPTSFGMPFYISYILMAVAAFLVLRFYGKKVAE